MYIAVVTLYTCLVGVSLSAPIVTTTRHTKENHHISTITTPTTTAVKPSDDFRPDDDVIYEISDTFELKPIISRRYGLHRIKDCRQFNATWSCIVNCRNTGYLTVRMDRACKCLCYDPMPTTTPPSTPPTDSTAETKKDAQGNVNFFHGLKLPTYVVPVWGSTRGYELTPTSTMHTTTPEPCVDVKNDHAKGETEKEEPGAEPGEDPLTGTGADPGKEPSTGTGEDSGKEPTTGTGASPGSPGEEPVTDGS